jgi:hypothetical protein
MKTSRAIGGGEDLDGGEAGGGMTMQTDAFNHTDALNHRSGTRFRGEGLEPEAKIQSNRRGSTTSNSYRYSVSRNLSASSEVIL